MTRFLPAPALLVVAAVTIFRIFAAAYMPLNDDEMYYWTWSRHPAFGYTDHPPLIAWLIAATSFLGKNPLALRSGFILCLGIGALAVGRAALALGESRSAAGLATIVFALIPQPALLVGMAKPDPPYLVFWAFALLFAARAAPARLGLAFAGAALTRFFGWAVLGGIVAWAFTPAGKILRNRLWIALAIFGILYAPFIYWNATHHWMNFAFTLGGRGFSAPAAHRFQNFHTLRFFTYAAIFIALTLAATRSRNRALLAWTAIPLILVFVVQAFFQNTETYWFLGPFTSLCVALAGWLSDGKRLWRNAFVAVWSVAALYTMAAIADAALTRGGPLWERNFVYMPLASSVQHLAAGRHAAAITDVRGVAATLEYSGANAILIGAAPQVPQWRQWFGDRVPQRALFVSNVPPDEDRRTLQELRAAFVHVGAGPVLTIRPSATSHETFYTDWCDGARIKQFVELDARATPRV